MSNEDDKGVMELRMFRAFAEAAGLALVPGSERKGAANLREPDIVCTVASQQEAFELAEACAPEFAAAASAAAKSNENVAVAWGDDSSHLTLRKKLSKQYSISCPLHLLLYTNGLTALPDQMVMDRLLPELKHGLGPFDSVWFFGKRAHRVATI